MSGRRAPVLALVLIALAVAGCGGGPAAATPAGAAREYFQAVADGDGETACGLLTGAALRGTEQSGGLAGNECITSVSGLAGSSIERISTAVTQESASSATVEVTLTVAGQQQSRIAVALVKAGEEWKIEGMGVPTPG